MKRLFLFKSAALAAAGALLLGSCAYDPYYTDVTYSQSYGYGGGSTSVLISTGDPRWGYDPYTYAYYDYHRRAYYDPYLYGYYPVGYRPPVIVGVPHPHGWRRGRVMPPPSRVRTVVLSDYRNRSRLYRQTDHRWADRVRESSRPPTRIDHRDSGRRSGPGGSVAPWNRSESPAGSPALRPDQRQRNPYIRERDDSRRGVQPAPGARPGTSWQDATNRERGSRVPNRFTHPVAAPEPPPVRGRSREAAPSPQPQRERAATGRTRGGSEEEIRGRLDRMRERRN